MNIGNFIKQYSFLFILLLFTFLFVGLKLFLNTQDDSLNNNSNTINTFTEKNIFYLILSVFIILIGIYIYNIIKFYNQNPILKLKPSYEIDFIVDSPKDTIVKNTDMECPQDERRFTFTFFLNIENFYCNRTGYWKPILLKGSHIEKKKYLNTACNNYDTNFIDNIEEKEKFYDFINKPGQTISEFTKRLESTLYTELNKHYTFLLKTDSFSKKFLQLKKIDINNSKIKTIDFKPFYTNNLSSEEANKNRIDLVCKILDNSDNLKEDKIKLFKSIVKNYKFINDKTLDEYTSELFLQKHKKYCDAVYAIDTNSGKSSDPQTLNLLKKDEKINPTKIDNKLFYDDYDSKCSLHRLRKNYDYLLPKNFELNSRMELINLAEKNNMDTFNPNPDNEGIEGYYYIPENELFIKVDRSDTTSGDDIKPKLAYYEKISAGDFTLKTHTSKEDAFNYCIENGFEYIIYIQSNSTTSKLYNSNTNPTVFAEPSDFDTVTGVTLSYLILDSTKIDILDNRYKKKPNKKKPDDTPKNYYLVKIEKAIQNKKQLLIDKCWNNITKSFTHQSPGIWLHPYVNDIRICVTTHSDKDYTKEINDTIEAYKFTNKKYYIEQINIHDSSKATKELHPELPNTGISTTKCSPQNKINVGVKYKYLEYIDIENIPIKEEFHFAVVLNDFILEIYINGKLRESIKLFGTIKYSDGNLQLNAGYNINLGGTINYFKYFPYALKANQINNIINEKNSTVKNEPSNISSNEHGHSVSIAHTHEYDSDTHNEHKHSIDDEDINHEYYIE